jgi:hypothetical protein
MALYGEIARQVQIPPVKTSFPSAFWGCLAVLVSAIFVSEGKVLTFLSLSRCLKRQLKDVKPADHVVIAGFTDICALFKERILFYGSKHK